MSVQQQSEPNALYQSHSCSQYADTSADLLIKKVMYDGSHQSPWGGSCLVRGGAADSANHAPFTELRENREPPPPRTVSR